MALPKRKGRLRVLLKSQALVIICLAFVGLLSCDAGTGSSTSSSISGSGTGTQWKIQVQVGTSQLNGGETTIVLATVRDGSGSPAPAGTVGCMTAVKNCFLRGSDCFATICDPISNNLGQFTQTYGAFLLSGTDTVEVSSQGVIQTAIITVN